MPAKKGSPLQDAIRAALRAEWDGERETLATRLGCSVRLISMVRAQMIAAGEIPASYHDHGDPRAAEAEDLPESDTPEADTAWLEASKQAAERDGPMSEDDQIAWLSKVVEMETAPWGARMTANKDLARMRASSKASDLGPGPPQTYADAVRRVRNILHAAEEGWPGSAAAAWHEAFTRPPA